MDTSNETPSEKIKAIHGVVKCIPAGKVASYGQVAALAGLPGRARLAGKALGVTINGQVIPWYRVLRSDGKIAFPNNSSHYKMQIAQLQDEGVLVTKGKVNMQLFQWSGELE